VTLRAKASPGRAFPLLVSIFEGTAANGLGPGGMPLGLVYRNADLHLTSMPGGGATVFAMREVFAGLLAGLITRSIPDLQPAFDAFAADLKRAAEKAG